MNLPIFDVVIDPNLIGLFAVSFVDEPAIEEDFIYFNKEKKSQLYLSSNEKREVVSPLLIPNQLIFRKGEDGKDFYLRWTAEAINEVAPLFLLNQFHNNVTIMHSMFVGEHENLEDSLVQDVYLKKLWITEDKNDIINTKYGFNVPPNTLCSHYKVHNINLWKKIKSGEVKGLSIEAFTKLVLSK